MEQLSRAFGDPRTRLVIISGEAGGGKSRLVAEFLQSVPEGNFVTVQCFKLAGESVSFPSLHEALGEPRELRGERARHLSDGQLVHFGYWASQVERRGGPEARSVLIIEDVHWADQTTLTFLAYLLRHPGNLLVVATRRNREPTDSRTSELFADVLSSPAAVQIPLGRLSIAESEAIVEIISEDETVRARRRQIAQRSDGNPYLLIELIQAKGALPGHVIEILMARTRQLDPVATTLLELIAMAGGRIEDELLAAASGVESLTYATAIRSLARADVVTFGTTVYHFRHSLTQEALERQMTPTDRRDRHRALAIALEKRSHRSPGDAAARALHWQAAGDRRRAAPAMLEAAREASSLYAHAEAWAHYKRAVELADDDIFQTTDLIIEAAEEARWSGDIQSAVALVATHVGTDRTADDLPRLLERLGRYLWESGLVAASNEALEEGARLLEGRPEDPLAVALAAAQARNLLTDGSYPESAAAARAASTRAQHLALPLVRLDAEITLGVAMVLMGHSDGLAKVQAAVRERHEADYEVTCRAYANLLFVLLYLGRGAEAAELAADGLQALRGRGLHTGVGATFIHNAVPALLYRGRIAECIELLDGLADRVALQGRANYLWYHRADIALLRDDLDTAERSLAKAAALRSLKDPWVLATHSRTEADVLAARGRPAESLALLERTLTEVRDTDPLLVAQLCRSAFRLLADTPNLDRSTPAFSERELHFSTLARYLSSVTGTDDDVTLDLEKRTAQAEMDRASDRDNPDSWAALTAQWASIGRPLEEGYCAYRHATSLARRRRYPAAARAAADARRVASETGYLALGRMVDDLVRHARLKNAADPPIEVAVAPATLPMGLSRRELEVLRLLATDGPTNREIAEQLFIAERTAALHVSAVLRKLGVSSRLQAAALAKRLEL